MARTRTGELHAVQCKLYAEVYRRQKSYIVSFFTASGRKSFSHRIIFSTTNDWSIHAEKVVLDLDAQCSDVRATVSDGGVNTEALDLWDRVHDDYCGDFELNEVVIDENGFVTDIIHTEWGSWSLPM